MKNSSEVACVFAMMEKVVFSSRAKWEPMRDSPWPVVSAMAVFSLNDPVGHPDDNCENMDRINSGKQSVRNSSCDSIT